MILGFSCSERFHLLSLPLRLFKFLLFLLFGDLVEEFAFGLVDATELVGEFEHLIVLGVLLLLVFLQSFEQAAWIVLLPRDGRGGGGAVLALRIEFCLRNKPRSDRTRTRFPRHRFKCGWKKDTLEGKVFRPSSRSIFRQVERELC